MWPKMGVKCACVYGDDQKHLRVCIPRFAREMYGTPAFGTTDASVTPGTKEWHARFALIDSLQGMWDYFKD